MSKTITTLARQLKAGQVFTYGAHTYTVTKVAVTPRSERQDEAVVEYEISTEGNQYAMGFYGDSTVLLHVTDEEHAAHQVRQDELLKARRRVAELQSELARAKSSGSLMDEGNALIVWNETDESGHVRRKSREYVTRQGYLKALIRMEGNIDKFYVVDVHESGFSAIF